MKKINILFILSFLYILSLKAQQFEVPRNMALSTPEDYRNSVPDVVQAYNWLLNTPVDQEVEKRKDVSAFLFKWMEGSPSVTVNLDSKIVTFLDCPDCLMIFMGGWTVHTLNNNYDKDPVKGATAGIRAVIDFYKKNKLALGINNNIEKYIKLDKKGKLEKYIADKMK